MGRRGRLRLRPGCGGLSRRWPGGGFGRSRLRGDVGEMRLGREVFELRLGRQVSELRFRGQVGELRLWRKLSGFGGQFGRLRFWGQVAQLRPLCQRSLLRVCWGRLLEDLWREAGLVHRRMMDGVDLTQCHLRGKRAEVMNNPTD